MHSVRESASAREQTEPAAPGRLLAEASLAERFGPVLMLTIIFFVHFMVRQMTGPLLPAMEADLGLTHTQGGFFVLLTGVGFCLSQVGAAFLAGSWGYRRCILVSLLGAAAASLALGLLEAVWALYLGFLALGVAGGIYVPSGISLITQIIRPSDWGKAMGLHELAPNLALISVPFLATAAVSIGSWRQGYLLLAAVLTVLGAVYAWQGIDAADRPVAPNLSRIRTIAASPRFWCLALLLSLAVGVETGVYAMTPLYLVNERAFGLAEANRLLGLSRIPGLFMVLLAGWITDRLGPSMAVIMALAVTGAAIVFLAIGPAYGVAPAVFVQAAASACLFPPILSMASAISTPESRTLTLSLSLAIAPVVGGGLLPAGIALAGDHGAFGAGMAATGILVAAGIALVRFMNRRPTEGAETATR
ncbi:MAG: MFS transporter [Desulfobacterales bacterium]|jgi:NNP family nitrate/nitrite transporter-like MFS transporter